MTYTLEQLRELKRKHEEGSVGPMSVNGGRPFRTMPSAVIEALPELLELCIQYRTALEEIVSDYQYCVDNPPGYGDRTRAYYETAQQALEAD